MAFSASETSGGWGLHLHEEIFEGFSDLGMLLRRSFIQKAESLLPGFLSILKGSTTKNRCTTVHMQPKVQYIYHRPSGESLLKVSENDFWW